MKKTLFSLGILGALLSACSKSEPEASDNAKVITANDFESVDGWMPTVPSLTRDQAHSGKYSIRVDGNTEFSLGYGNLLGKVSPTKLRKLNVEAWVYAPSAKSQARLGVQVTDPVTGKEIFGDGITITDQVKEYKKWVKISKEIVLPENITATQVLKVFLWRASASDAAYMDDIRVVAVE